jgi:hypothetical protein
MDANSVFLQRFSEIELNGDREAQVSLWRNGKKRGYGVGRWLDQDRRWRGGALDLVSAGESRQQVQRLT